MAKDDRKIVTAIRTPTTRDDKRLVRGELITDPDDLVKSGIDLQRLHDVGAITGTWKGVKPQK